MSYVAMLSLSILRIHLENGNFQCSQLVHARYFTGTAVSNPNPRPCETLASPNVEGGEGRLDSVSRLGPN